MAQVSDGRQALQQPADTVFFFRSVRHFVGRAALDEFGEYGAEDSEVAAAGPAELQVFLEVSSRGAGTQ